MDIGYAGAFLGGVATLLSPCAALLLPAFFAYAFSGPRQLLGRTGIFFLGLLTTLVPLGVAASTLGGYLASHRQTFVIVAAGLVIVFGIVQALAVPVPLPKVGRGDRDARSPLAVYLLGMSYGLAGACSGPILGSVLAVAAIGGDPAYGGVLLALMGAGMVLPLLLLALIWERFDVGSRSWLRPRPVRIGPIRTSVMQLVSGVVFIAIGALLMLTEGTAALPGLLDSRQQQRLEVQLREFAASIPDVALVLGLAVLAALVVWVLRRPRPDPNTSIDANTGAADDTSTDPDTDTHVSG